MSFRCSACKRKEGLCFLEGASCPSHALSGARGAGEALEGWGEGGKGRARKGREAGSLGTPPRHGGCLVQARSRNQPEL